MRLLIPALLLVLAPSVHADIYVGRDNGNESLQPANAISLFRDDADGDVAPKALLGGDVAGLRSPADLIHDRDLDSVVVADFRAQSIRRYSLDARGNAAPVASFHSGSLGQPRSIVAIDGVNEYAVITRLCCISYFARNSSGNVAPLRQSTSGSGGLDNPTSIAYLAASDEVVVGDYQSISGGSRGELLFFDRMASGSLVPTRVIAGTQARLGLGVRDVLVDAAHGEIYALVYDASVGGKAPARILVFALDASGDVAPLREIGGSNTGLFNAPRLALDDERGEVLVTVGNSVGPTGVLVFDRLDHGDPAPRRRISGPNTGDTAPGGFGALLVVHSDRLHGDGFE
jgi:hypothetical protein